MIKREDIQVLYSYQGDIARFIAWLATRGIPNAKLIWGIQGSGQRNTLTLNDWRESLPFYLCKWVSASVHLMVSGSNAGYISRKAKGYSCPKQIVIFYGIDINQFQLDPRARVRMRSEWGVPEDEKLIGRIARLAPDKGYPTFLEAAALLSKERKDVRFVIAGDGPESYKRQLQLLSQELGLTERLIWAGARQDMSAVYNALDILCSSSDSEGFGLTVAEAMACGVPCVATDVGDSAKIVGDKGIVVPPGNPQILADGLKTMLHRLHGINPLELRERIVSRFSIEKMVEATEKALSEVCRSSI
jgi:glycosyltransferase involved in cell wall biosynthesis